MRFVPRALASVALLSLTLAPIAHAQKCVAPLAAFGPIDPANGFPQWYQDSNNVRLAPCLDLACDPALAVPNPALPVSFPGNFPVETFYLRAVSKFTAGNVSALLGLALEGSFANGVQAIAGDQVVFTRVRVRITGLTPGGTYTITHPYGIETLQAAGGTAAVPGVINFTRDSPRVPASLGAAAAFAPALAGDVGPFLSFATGAVPPPAGMIVTPATDQTLTGSACGTNFFRIEGPGLPAGGIQSNIFNPVVGKKAPCGNGILDPGEQCDDGNFVNGDCCSATCTFEAAGSACTDNNACTTDACNGAGACVSTPINCNDGNVCTTDGCDPATGCTHVNNTIGCSDGNACTVGDTCSAGSCVSGPAPNCDDGNVCTVDSCDKLTGCVHTAVSCNDGNVCTNDSCDPVAGCTHVNNTAPCNDGNACTVGDTCSAGSCTAGTPVNCNDNNACTVDSCNPATGCTHTPAPVGTVCDDGNPATKFDACTATGSCVGVRLLAPLTLASGENPSKSPTLPASGDARWDGSTIRVRLINMDPARFPAGSACQVTVQAGSASGAGTITNGVVGTVAVTNMDFSRAGTARLKDSATVSIRCTVGAVRHQTGWQGTFALP